jgi:hypothetical protein
VRIEVVQVGPQLVVLEHDGERCLAFEHEVPDRKVTNENAIRTAAHVVRANADFVECELDDLLMDVFLKTAGHSNDDEFVGDDLIAADGVLTEIRSNTYGSKRCRSALGQEMMREG